MGHLKPSASHDASAEVNRVLQGALRELLAATTALCVPMSTAAIHMDKNDNGNNKTTSTVTKPVEMFVLGSIHLWGNPFSANSAEDWATSFFADEQSNNNEGLPAGATRDGADEEEDGNVEEEEGDGDVASGSSSSSSSNNNSNEAVVVRRLERRQFGTAWTVTRPALHVAACVATYSALMLHLPWVAADAHAGLGQLAKLYMYNVLTLFAPPKALRALCLPPQPSRAGTGGGSEASTSRSTGMGLRSSKRSGANNKEGSDGSGSDHESSSAAAANNNASTRHAPASSSEQLLSADARAFADLKRYAMLAAEEFSAPGSMSAGGGASSSRGARTSAKSSGSGLRARRSNSSSSSTASNTDAAAAAPSSTGVSGEPKAIVPRPLVEYPAAVVPVTREGGLCGPDNLWALRERIAAAQSLIFVLEVGDICRKEDMLVGSKCIGKRIEGLDDSCTFRSLSHRLGENMKIIPVVRMLKCLLRVFGL